MRYRADALAHVFCLITLWLFLAGQSCAKPLTSALYAHLPPAVDLAAIEGVERINGAFLATRELPENGELPAPQPGNILARPLSAWEQAIHPQSTLSHFQLSRVWLLGSVDNQGSRPVTRSLTLKPWRLATVEFLELDPLTGRILARQVSRVQERLSDGSIFSVEASYSLTLGPGEQRLLLIRAEAPSFGVLVLEGSEPNRLLEARTQFYAYSLILLGMVTGLVMLLLSQRSAALALTAGWLFATVNFELSYLTPIIPTLLSVPAEHITVFYAIGGAISASLFALGTVSLFSGPHTRRWLLVLGAIAALTLFSSATPLWTDQHVFLRKLGSRLMLLSLTLTPFAVLHAYRGSHRPAKRLLLVLSTGIWALAALRVAIAAGVQLTLDEHEPIMLVYIPLLTLLVLALLVTDLRSRTVLERSLREVRQRIKAEQQQYLLNLERSENARLAAAVEERTQELNHAKERAEKSSLAKSLFLSGISHDLRAPLHDVLGYVSLALRHVRGREARQLQVVERRGRELLNMINDLLEFVRGEAPSLTLAETPINLREFARFLEFSHENVALEQNNRLTTTLALNGGEWVLADEQRLSQLLGNLLQNACRYTRDGEVNLAIETLPTGNSEEDDCADQNDGEAGAQLVSFTVTDNGVGIPLEDQERVFEPFERGESARYVQGTGLGLGIVRQIVTAMGGFIALQSDPAKAPGTAITVTLPLKPRLEALLPAVEKPSEDLSSKRTILIIDDEESHRAYLAGLCELWQVRALQATGAEEGIALLEARVVTIDAVVIDQRMPGCNAWQFLQRIRVQPCFAELPVILVSTVAPEPPEDFAVGNNFEAYVQKPYSAEGMAAILGLFVPLPKEIPLEDNRPADV